MSDTLTIELPEDVAREVERLARQRGMTPAEFVARAAADKIGAAASAAAYFAARAARAKPGAFERVFGLAREDGETPAPDDAIDEK